MMDRKRRLALIFATVGVAMGTGHIIQSRAVTTAPGSAAAAPTAIVPVSAGPGEGTQTTATVPAAVAPAIPPSTTVSLAPAAPVPAVASQELPAAVAPDNSPAPIVVADLTPSLGDLLPKPVLPSAPAAAPATPAASAPAVTSPVAASSAAPVVAAEDPCTPNLRLAAAPQAMIGVSLVAPCAPDARIVISHGGLTITGKTNGSGSLFLSVPALEVEASVTARLPDGAAVEQNVRVPAMATMRRMGVQWHDQDAFQLHAFEDGAGYGEPGHIWADAPQIPTTGLGDTGGFITVLGDASVALPMMAEIYTFPAGIAANADIMIEAVVTEATCGRELLGETVMTLAGEVYITELTLAMPGCDAVGDILVLKNLLTDLTVAAAN